jgi:prepilin-type N-terminal cleavage/methylation domain-containing protein
MALVQEKRNGSVSGINNKYGFTFIELLIVILIIAIMGSVLAPRLAPRTARAEKEEFISQLNGLLRAALTQAIMTQTLHQVYWHLENKTVEIRKHTGEYDRSGDPICKAVRIPYGTQQVTIPERFIIKQFVIEGINELAHSRTLKEVWFYIVPDGIAQEVTVVFADTHEEVSDADKKLTLILNPFTVQYAQQTA